MDNEIKSLPMVALRGMTIMPEMVVHFDVSRERSIAAVQEAMVEEQKIFLTAQKSIDTEDPGAEDVYEIGTVGTIKQIIKLPKHIVRVLVSGEVRGRLKEIEYKDPYLRAQVEIINDADLTIPEDLNGEAMERGLKDMLVEYAAKNGKMSKESVAQLLDIKGIKKLVDEIAANIPLYYTDQQEILNETDFWKRYEKLCFKLVKFSLKACHLWRSDHIIHCQRRILFQLRVLAGRTAKLMPRCSLTAQCVDFPDFLHYFKQSRPARDSIGLERRRDRKTDCFLRPALIRYHQICCHRVQPPLHTLYRGIK